MNNSDNSDKHHICQKNYAATIMRPTNLRQKKTKLRRKQIGDKIAHML